MKSHAKLSSVGASSGRRGRVGVFATAFLFVLALIAAPVALAGKTVDHFAPTPGTGLGGSSTPRDIAVNETSGDFYIAEAERIQRFSADGVPELMWGKDVVEGNASTGYEICTETCKGGEQGTLKGEFRNLGGITVDQANGDVYAWDQRGGSSLATNVRIQKFDADGNFILMFGKGVDATTGGDICTEISGDVCQRGTPGNAAGQLGSNVATTHLAVGPNGDVFVADPANRRIQQFSSGGVFIRAWGWGVDSGANALQICTATSTCQGGLTTVGADNGRFGSGQPLHITVDSAGIVYASDSNGSNRVLRFDPSAIPDSATAGAAPAGFLLSPIGVGPLLNAVTSGLKIELDKDGSGPDEDRLLVARDPTSGESVVQEVGGLAVPGSTPTVVDTDAVGDGFGAISFLGINGVTGDLYLAGSETVGSVGSGYFVLDADGTGPVAVAIKSPANVEATEVDLSGTVDSGGGQASYYFEYSTNGSTWSALPKGTTSGAGPQPVSTSLDGLDPNTTYRARLNAEKVVGPTTVQKDTSEEAVFVTDKAPPVARTRPVHAYTDHSAWLVGDVDPNGSNTTYRFEWGPFAAYGHQTPIPEASAGQGGSAEAHLVEISGLAPMTTYHYRVVAESSEGISFGLDHSFTTRPAFTGFSNRAYEQVSPVFKNNGAIRHDIVLSEGSLVGSASRMGNAAAVASDGSAAVFSSADVFADAEWGPNTPGSEVPFFYQARRKSDGSGWVTKASIPRAPSLGINGLNALTTAPGIYGGPADSKTAFVSALSMTGATPPNPGEGVLRDLTSGSMSTLFEGVDGQTAGLSPVVGASADFDRVFFESPLVLTTDLGVPPSAMKLYEWHAGQISLVSIDTSGNPLATSARLGRYNGRARRAAVSDDGRYAFFSSAPEGSGVPASVEIYRHDAEAGTSLVSPSRASTADPLGPKGKVFSAASDDGDVVYFMSSEQLTDDANTGPTRGGSDLYRYTASTDTLIDVSAETNDIDGARVRGTLGISEDGDTAYFVARGQLVSGEGDAGGNNVYRWHDDGSPDGQIRYVATLAPDAPPNTHPNDAANLGADSPVNSAEQGQTSRVSDDGKTLLFESVANPTGYRNQGFAELYVYEGDANDGKGQLSCVSCSPTGATATSNSYVPYSGIASESGDAPARVLSADGSRVFFNSEADLLAADRNGVQDVYMWEDGRLQLISSGRSSDPSFLHGASASGDDVFFLTREQLVGQDADGLIDIYDYRVDGGIAQQNPGRPGEPCNGEACKPAPNPPAALAIPSVPIAGGGNVVQSPRRRCPKGKHRVKTRGKTRCVKRRKRTASHHRRIQANARNGKVNRQKGRTGIR